MAQLTDVGCGLLVVWKGCKMFTGGYDVAKLRVAWLINIMLLLFFVALLLWDILSYYGEIPFGQVFGLWTLLSLPPITTPITTPGPAPFPAPDSDADPNPRPRFLTSTPNPNP